MRSRLFVGGLPEEATEGELERLFAQVGEVQYVSIIKERETGKPRGFGFVQMATDAQATEAIDRFHGTELHGRELRVLVAEPKGQKPAGHRPSDPPPPLVEDPALHETPAPPDVEPSSTSGFIDRTPLPTRKTFGPWIGFVVILLSLGAIGGWLLTRPRPPKMEVGTVLVLPFDVSAPSEGAGYLGFAFAQAIAVNLAPVAGLKVLPVPNVDEVRAKSSDERAHMAVGMGAGRLLTGAISRKESGGVHVSLTLVEPLENRILWGVQSDASDEELLSLAADYARQIGTQLGVQFPEMFAYITDLTGGPAMSSSAALSKAIGALRRGEVDDSMATTERLVEAFPTEPDALSLRCLALAMKWDASRSPENLEALEAALVKLEGTGQGYPYAEFFRSLLLFDRHDDRDAIARFTKLIDDARLAPAAKAWVLRYRAFGRQRVGDMSGALDDLQASLRLDPTNAVTLGILSSAALEAGRIEEALTRAEQGLALAPSQWRNHQAQGQALLALNRPVEAAEAFGRACELVQGQLPCSLRAIALLKAGAADEAKQAATRAAALPESFWGAYNLACYSALAGETERALDYLEKSVQLGLSDRTIERDRDLDSLRKTERFKGLLARVQARLAEKP